LLRNSRKSGKPRWLEKFVEEAKNSSSYLSNVLPIFSALTLSLSLALCACKYFLKAPLSLSPLVLFSVRRLSASTPASVFIFISALSIQVYTQNRSLALFL
jgi:hypothetical protein